MSRTSRTPGVRKALPWLLSLALSMSVIAGSPLAQAEVKVGFLSFSSTSLPIFVAQELKLPQKHGLKLQPVPFTSPDTKDTSFAGGRTDFTSLVVDGGANLRAEGQDVVYVYGMITVVNSVVTRKGFAGTGVKDLVGKRLGLHSDTGSMMPVWLQMAKEAGSNLKKDIKIVLAPPPALPKLLAQGKVDAIEIWEPHVSKLLATGKFQVMFSFNDYYKSKVGSSLPFALLATRESFIKKNREETKKTVAVIAAANRYIKDNPREAISIMAKKLRIKNPKVISLLEQSMPREIMVDWNQDVVKAVKPYLDWALEAGMLRKPVPPGLFNLEFAP